MVEDKAIHFEKSNISDLADKLQMLCDKQDIRDDYKKNAEEFILGKYNWNDVAKSTHNLYKKVLNL